MKTFRAMVLGGIFLLPFWADAAKKQPERKIRYKSSKEINLKEILIQGKIDRPNLSVVTGSISNDNSGLLRLRKNFLDRISMDYGEEIK